MSRAHKIIKQLVACWVVGGSSPSASMKATEPGRTYNALNNLSFGDIKAEPRQHLICQKSLSTWIPTSANSSSTTTISSRRSSSSKGLSTCFCSSSSGLIFGLTNCCTYFPIVGALWDLVIIKPLANLGVTGWGWCNETLIFTFSQIWWSKSTFHVIEHGLSKGKPMICHGGGPVEQR